MADYTDDELLQMAHESGILASSQKTAPIHDYSDNELLQMAKQSGINTNAISSRGSSKIPKNIDVPPPPDAPSLNEQPEQILRATNQQQVISQPQRGMHAAPSPVSSPEPDQGIVGNYLHGMAQEFSHQPVAATASMLEHLPGGAIGALPDAAINGLAQAAQLAQQPGIKEKLHPALQSFYKGISDLQAAMNQGLGRPPTAPSQIESSIDRVMGQPRQAAFGPQPQTPNAAATGGFAGGIIPGFMGGAMAESANPAVRQIGRLMAPEALGRNITNPIARGAAQGAQYGAGFNAVANVGQQAEQQLKNRKISTLNPGQIAGAGAMGAAGGAALGGALGAFQPKPTPQTAPIGKAMTNAQAPEAMPAAQPPRQIEQKPFNDESPHIVDAEVIGEVPAKQIQGPEPEPKRIETKPNKTLMPWQKSYIPMSGKPSQITNPTPEQLAYGKLLRGEVSKTEPALQGEKAPPMQRLSQVRKPTEKPAEAPPSRQEMPPQPMSKRAQKVQQEAQIMQAEPKDIHEALTRIEKNPHDEVAARWIEDAFNKKASVQPKEEVVSEKKKPPEPSTTKKTEVEPPKAIKAIAEKYNRPVPSVSPMEQSIDNAYVKRAEMSEVESGTTKEKDESAFDWNNPKPREGYGTDTDTGEVRKMLLMPVKGIDKNGNPIEIEHEIGKQNYDQIDRVTHLAQARYLSKDGWASQRVKEQIGAAKEAISKGTTLVQQLRKGHEWTEQQQHANEQLLLKHAATGDLTAAQAQAAKIAKEQQAPSWRGVTSANPINALFDMTLWAGKKAAKDVDKLTENWFGKNFRDSIASAFWHQNTHDVINQYTPKLDTQLRMNEALEARARMGIGWEGDFRDEAQKVFRTMSPSEILTSSQTSHWTPEQRQGVAEAKFLRMDSKQLIKDTLDDLGDAINPRLEEHLKDYNGQLYGGRSVIPHSHMDDLGTVVQTMSNHMASGWFDKNPKFTGLVLTHPAQLGPGIFGYKALGKAYWLNATDKEINQMISSHPLTADYRDQFRGKKGGPLAQKANEVFSGLISKATAKLPENVKNFSAAKYNNEIFALGNAVDKFGIDKVREFAKGINSGKPTLSQTEEADISLAMWQGLEDATGGTSSEFGRSFIERNRSARFLAPLTGYTSGVARLYLKQTKMLIDGTPKQKLGALMNLVSLQTARAVLGGDPLPPEVQEPMEIAMARIDPDTYLSMKYAMHNINLPRKFNADISKHTSSGFKLGGNLIIPNVKSVVSAGARGDYVKAGARLAQLIGGPIGGLAGRATEAGEKLAAGKETVSVYMRSGIGSPFRVAQGTRKYGPADFARDQTVAGEDREKADFEEKQRIIYTLKKADADIPMKELDVEYPTPNFSEGTEPPK